MESWKDVPDFEGKYQVSNTGQVRSVSRYITQIGRWGRPFVRAITGRILRPACSEKNPHLYVVLGKKGGSFQVHQLVARAFIGPCPQGLEVRHLDGNAQNNELSNLCYGTRTDNILDVLRIGRAWRKLTLTQVAEIRSLILREQPVKEIAQIYEVTPSTIYRIKSGVSFKCDS